MLLQVHDELVFEAPAEEVKRVGAMAREAMSGVAELAVPLDVGVASGPNWAAAK
jgi:DNA polymerase-1